MFFGTWFERSAHKLDICHREKIEISAPTRFATRDTKEHNKAEIISPHSLSQWLYL